MGCCQKLAHGVVALVKVAVGMDAAREAVIAERRAQCRRCDQATRSPDPRFAANAGLTTFSRCRACGCFIAAKTRVAGEECPIQLWPKVR